MCCSVFTRRHTSNTPNNIDQVAKCEIFFVTTSIATLGARGASESKDISIIIGVDNYTLNIDKNSLRQAHRLEIMAISTCKGYLETDVCVEEEYRASVKPAWPFLVFRRSDVRAAGEARTHIAVLPPVTRRGDRDEQPKQSAGEVDPDGMLHAGDGAVAAGVLVEEELWLFMSVTISTLLLALQM